MQNLDLQEIRNKLDEVDKELVSLFEERMKLCAEVAEFKIRTGKPVYDKEREQQKLESVGALAHSEFNRQAVTELFSQIMTISRRYQYQVLAGHGKSTLFGFEPVEKLAKEKVQVVYQGVEGAYSHEAAIRYFGKGVSARHVPSWEEAMEEVSRKKADYAVLPIENSSAGAVSSIYDLLVKYNNYIVGEVFLDINHALLGLPGAALEDVRTVYSHPQALMQCSEYLNANKNWRQISAANTALAAKKVLEDGDKSQAAVASENAGRIYGLVPLQRSINHNKSNTTRFIVVANRPVYQIGSGKVSICFELPHKSGTLYNMLGNFIFNDVNMVMIESRPIVGKNWEYRFFVDIEGSLSDAPVRNALMGIAQEAAGMRILGNY